MDVFEELDLFPVGDLKFRIVEQRGRQANRSEEAFAVNSLRPHFVAQGRHADGRDDNIVVTGARPCAFSRPNFAESGIRSLSHCPLVQRTSEVCKAGECSILISPRYLALAEFAATPRLAQGMARLNLVKAPVLRQVPELEVAKRVGRRLRDFRPALKQRHHRAGDAINAAVDCRADAAADEAGLPAFQIAIPDSRLPRRSFLSAVEAPHAARAPSWRDRRA